MDLTDIVEWKKPDARVHAVRFHLYEVQGEIKQIYDDGSQNSSYFYGQEGILTKKQHRDFEGWDIRNICLDQKIVTEVYIYIKSYECVHFTVRLLYLNKKNKNQTKKEYKYRVIKRAVGVEICRQDLP